MKLLHMVNPAAITILEVIGDRTGCTQRDIQRDAGMNYDTVSQYVKLLQTCGLIEVRQGDIVEHRNAFTITLTDNGRSAIKTLNQLEALFATSSPANGAQWSDVC